MKKIILFIATTLCFSVNMFGQLSLNGRKSTFTIAEYVLPVFYTHSYNCKFVGKEYEYGATFTYPILLAKSEKVAIQHFLASNKSRLEKKYDIIIDYIDDEFVRVYDKNIKCKVELLKKGEELYIEKEKEKNKQEMEKAEKLILEKLELNIFETP